MLLIEISLQKLNLGILEGVYSDRSMEGADFTTPGPLPKGEDKVHGSFLPEGIFMSAFSNAGN
jgi:hypothetical protein